MLTEYIEEAMKLAHYEIIEDEGNFWGEIPGFQGVWGKAKTLEECRDELKDTLEEWLVFRLKNNLELPVVADIDINEHDSEIGAGFLKRLLNQAGVSREEWLKE